MDVVARDCNGTPIREDDTVVVLGTLGTVKHVVQRIEQYPMQKGQMETFVIDETGRRLLPVCVRKEVPA